MPQVSQNTKQEPAVRQAGHSKGPGWMDDAGPQEQLWGRVSVQLPLSLGKDEDQTSYADKYTMEYHSAIKRNTFESVLMRWMNLEPIIQSELS